MTTQPPVHRPDFDAMRRKFPELAGLSDQEILERGRYAVIFINEAIVELRRLAAEQTAKSAA